MQKLIWILCVAAAFSGVAAADDGHHDELTQEQLGTVHFPVACTPGAQKTFEKGVALLHSFWYEEAEKTFAAARKEDPKCAMAYWGEATSMWHQLWDEPKQTTIKKASDDLKKAEKIKGKTTERERDYIHALSKFYSNSAKAAHDARAQAHCAAMKKVDEKYPEDHEAAAFYALSLLASAPDEDPTFANNKKAGAILEKLFDQEPSH